MYIGIDARPLQGETQYRGIGKALGHMLNSLPKHLSTDDKLVFFVDDGLPLPKLLSTFSDKRVIKIPTSRLGRTRYVRSVLPSYRPIKPSSKDVDVLLQYDASLGIPTTVPTVSAFHDLIPLLFRGQEKKDTAKLVRRTKNAMAREMYWKKYMRVLNNYKSARIILAISESSKKDLLKHMKNIDPSSVDVVYLGVNNNDRPAAGSDKIHKLTKDPYLLYVGGIDLRKNIVGLLDTFYDLKPNYPDLKLITVGKEFSLEDQLEDLGWRTKLNSKPEYAKDVIAPGFLPDEDVLYLYHHASAFVFPSLYEGFGLPILEAMQLGCPVVAYANSSVVEVAGTAGILLPDRQPMAPSIEKLLKDSSLRKSLITKGKKQAAKFTWDRCAKETLSALKRAAN